MDLTVVRYDVDGPIATITMNRPHYLNAQDYRLLDEIDVAMDMAKADKAVRVIVVRGSGGNFSSGHDLGTPEAEEYRKSLGAVPGVETYDQFKKYNLDLLLKWRNHPKPTIAMVEGYCIYAGWMLTACLDIVFAADNSLFLAGVVEYMAIPWDVGVRRAKELVFESRFITAEEALSYGLVNRVVPLKDLERETYGFARRVAENSPLVLRFAKVEINKAQDHQGYTNALEDSLGDYVAMSGTSERGLRMEGQRRLTAVDLAVRGRRGDRFGLKKTKVKTTAPRRLKDRIIGKRSSRAKES